MIDLTAQQSQATGTLTRLTVRRDGREETAGLLFDLDVTFCIEKEMAAHLAIVPGAAEMQRRSGVEEHRAHTRAVVKPADLTVEVDLANPGGTDLAGGFAEVIHAKYNAKDSVVTYTVRLRLHGLEGVESGDL